jgi:hypothetical protein
MSGHATHDTEVEIPALLDAVEADPELQPAEKETSIGFSWGDDMAEVFTAEPGLARRLLAHPERGATSLIVADGDDRPELDPTEHNGEPITGVNTEIPVGALKISAKPRGRSDHADIVTRVHLREARK